LFLTHTVEFDHVTGDTLQMFKVRSLGQRTWSQRNVTYQQRNAIILKQIGWSNWNWGINVVIKARNDRSWCRAASSYYASQLIDFLVLHVVRADGNCEDVFQINSTCYKIHKEPVPWFTAVNRCLSYNASLAVFDDDVRRYFPSSLLSVSYKAWIGLIKSWWRWTGLV